MNSVCQVADRSTELECTATESGGLRCERSGQHERHSISEHTILHALAGNGYRCAAVTVDRLDSSKENSDAA